MKTTIFFSICRYVPSLLRGEKVNVGFAYHLPSEGLLGFYDSKNMKRIRNFDDEVEADMIHAVFESLKYDFSSDYLDGVEEYEDKKLFSNSLLKSKIKNYVNQIQFSDVSVYETCDNLDKAIEDIADMYLYFDKPKSQRMNHQRVQALARKIIKSSAYKDDLINSSSKDVFFDPPYDFKVSLNGQMNYIKGFSFEYKQANRFYKEFKSYLFDLEHEITNSDIDISNFKIVINNTEFEEEHEKVIQEYLPEELDIITLEKFGEYINSSNYGLFNQ
ncbi:DUF3037 domain-containing protein [Sporosarcina koreensis]|uniref:DUF3037 domain-containing protein n=1 Tax=Sporosarcina koreensis TaxID=334735 RepID=UPI00058CFC39|nr:DUF3037 domain-containing protein [Sporosarcina koreensis]